MSLVEYLNTVDLETCVKREPLVYQPKPQIYGNWEIISGLVQGKRKCDYGFFVKCLVCKKTIIWKQKSNIFDKKKRNNSCSVCSGMKRRKNNALNGEIIGSLIILDLYAFSFYSLIFCMKCKESSFIRRTTLKNRKKGLTKTVFCHSCRPFDNCEDRLNVLLKISFDIYKRSAIKRKYSFELTFNIFSMIILKSCYYCNLKSEKKDKYTNISFFINGIDRIDSKKGYTESNTVPCCSTCNYAKKSLSLKKFRDWAKGLCQNMDNW